MTTPIDLSKLRPGQELLVGRRRYTRCLDCMQVVWINKPLVGSIHLCVDPSG